jgi:hypothetical protein
MPWFTVIYWIVKFGIALWPLISEILAGIGKKGGSEQPALVMALEEAAKEAKTSGNRARLRQLRDRLNVECHGPFCPGPRAA